MPSTFSAPRGGSTIDELELLEAAIRTLDPETPNPAARALQKALLSLDEEEALCLFPEHELGPDEDDLPADTEAATASKAGDETAIELEEAEEEELDLFTQSRTAAVG